MLFTRPATVAQALAVLGKSYDYAQAGSYSQRVRLSLADYRDAAIGGEACRRFLKPRPGEDPTVWFQRYDAFQNIGLVETVVDEQSTFLYGKSPEIKVSLEGEKEDAPASVAINDLVRGIYDANGLVTLRRKRLAPAMFVDQRTWVKVWTPSYAEAGLGPKIRISQIPRCQIEPIMDPEDPRDTMFGIIEHGHEKTTPRRVWTSTETVLLDDGGKPVGAPEKHGLGMIPFVDFGDTEGPHQLADPLIDQKILINLRSWEMTGWRYQAFALLVLMGDLLDDEVASPVDGERRVPKGINSIWHLDKESTLAWANPDMKIAEMRKAGSDLFREAIERAKVSATAIDASGTPERPEALKLRMMRPLADRDMNIAAVKPQEVQLARVVLATARLRQLTDVPVENLVVKCEFSEDALPIDRDIERQRDAGDVEAYRQAKVDYVMKWVKPNLDREAALEYVRDLDAAKALAESALTGLFNAGAGAPPRPAPKPPGAPTVASDIYGAGDPAIAPPAPPEAAPAAK